MPKINWIRPEVQFQSKRWKQIRDCLAGQDVVKGAGIAYLPMPNAEDQSTENKERYKAYVKRAMFLNATANTCEGLVGQVFSTDPVVDLPEEMAVLENDADGNGVTLTQVARATVTEVLALGRRGLLTDYPDAPKDEEGKPRAFTRAEIQEGSAHPTIIGFSPESILNWRVRLRGTKTVLSLVVLAGSYVYEDDGFELVEKPEWRVLKLTAADRYVVEIWRENLDPATKSAEPFIRFTTYEPKDYAGNPLDFIPFTFVGSMNNNEFPDKPPLYDLSNVNLAHYCNSADYEDSVYMVGQPTPVITGLSTQWVKEVFKDKPIRLGSRGSVPLPQGADMKLVSAEANGLVKEAMQDKERQMVALGAQLVEQKEVQRTLGEAKMEKATTTSILVQCAKNSAAAVQKCLRWASLFYGPLNEKLTYELSTDFSIVRMSAEERKVLLADWQAGAISFTEMRNALRQSGVAYLDDVKAKAEIDLEMESRVDMDADDEGGEGNGNGPTE